MARTRKIKWNSPLVLLIALATTISGVETVFGPLKWTYEKSVWVYTGIKAAHQINSSLVPVKEYRTRVILMDQRWITYKAIIDSMKKHSITEDKAKMYLKRINQVFIGELDYFIEKGIQIHYTNDSATYYYYDGWLFDVWYNKNRNRWEYENFFTNEIKPIR